MSERSGRRRARVRFPRSARTCGASPTACADLLCLMTTSLLPHAHLKRTGGLENSFFQTLRHAPQLNLYSICTTVKAEQHHILRSGIQGRVYSKLTGHLWRCPGDGGELTCWPDGSSLRIAGAVPVYPKKSYKMDMLTFTHCLQLALNAIDGHLFASLVLLNLFSQACAARRSRDADS